MDTTYKTILETIPLPAVCITENGPVMNRAAECFTGYSNSEIDSVEKWENIFIASGEGSNSTNFSGADKLKAGILMKDDTIKRTEYVIQICDNMKTITLYPYSDYTFLEDNLKDKDRILSAIYDSTSDLMFLVSADDDGGFTYLSVNNTFINLTGLAKQECLGKQAGQVFEPDISYNFIRAFKEAALRKEKVKIEFNYIHDGRKLFFDASFRPIMNLDDRCVYVLVVARDLTERKRKEDELISTKILAEESNKLKTALLTNLSHEFRTPLNGILGFADLLSEELSNPDQKEMAVNIARSGRRLFSTLNSILELSRLESEGKEIYNTTIRIYDIISEIVKKYQHEAENKGLFFNLEIKAPSLKLHLDESILMQILHNLIDNAIKFTKEGGIKIVVEERFEEMKSYAYLRIIDTGIGISKENIESIFKEFKQESEGIGRSHEGTGLGLTLAKKMTELMGGKILVESKKHKGSVFSLKFPAMGSRIEKIKLETSSSLPVIPVKRSGRMPLVLLVEDNELNSKLTTVYLKDTCVVDSVQNAADALKLINEKTYHAILMDVNLGEGMNGVDIAQSARTMDKYYDTPIIAITGYALNNDKEKLLKCGFSHYLAKPYAKNQLLELINEALYLKAV